MSALRLAPTILVKMKPRHGEPCNRCGLCCFMSLCPLAQAVFQRSFEPGPCPALRGGPGEAACGLVQEPALYREGEAPALSAAAALLIYAGKGCDSRIGGEPTNHQFERQIFHDELGKAEQITAAKKLWGWK